MLYLNIFLLVSCMEELLQLNHFVVKTQPATAVVYFDQLLGVHAPRSWSKYFFQLFSTFFCSFQTFFSDFMPEINKTCENEKKTLIT